MIQWYSKSDSLSHAIARLLPRTRVIEDALAAVDTVTGYCVNCDAETPFTTQVGVWMGEYPNLREGMRCQACGANGRARFLLDALMEELAADGSTRVALLEAQGPLHDGLARRAAVSGSEYFGAEVAPGTLSRLGNKMLRHEDVTRLSYDDASFDIVAHNDVLEHVFDTRAALAEMLRVLVPGGRLLFSVPYFHDLDASLLRGRIEADGSLTKLLPDEYHGDGLRADGIYTFHHFGPDLLEMVRDSGFVEVEVGLDYDPHAGYVGNNYRYGGHGLMLPTLVRARKPGGAAGRAAWRDTLLRSLTVQQRNRFGDLLPAFPPEQLQRNTTGLHSRDALLDALGFHDRVIDAMTRADCLPGPDAKLLDFGFGWGRIARTFLDDFRLANIHGADVDPTFAALTRELFSSPNFQQCQPFPPLAHEDASVDLVVSFSVFSHLSEDACREWMREFARVVKPGGMVAFTTRDTRFFDICEWAASQVDADSYIQGLGALLPDPAAAREDYAAGRLVHASSHLVGGGGPRDATFYGETWIPEQYARDAYGPAWRLVASYVGEEGCSQAVFCYQRMQD